MSRKMLACLLLLMTAGCSTTTDPRQGGLFGYNPTAYEKHLDERRQMLDALERNKQQSQEKSQQLQKEAEEKRDVLDRQKETLSALESDLAKLDTDMVNIQNEVNRYQDQTTAQKREKQRINNEINILKRQADALRKSTNLAEAEKQEKIAKIKSQISALSQAATTLTLSNQ